jgi:hypothetical protein
MHGWILPGLEQMDGASGLGGIALTTEQIAEPGLELLPDGTGANAKQKVQGQQQKSHQQYRLEGVFDQLKHPPQHHNGNNDRPQYNQQFHGSLPMAILDFGLAILAGAMGIPTGSERRDEPPTKTSLILA